MPVEPPPEEAEEEECPPKWNEPTTVSELLEKYLVEAKSVDEIQAPHFSWWEPGSATES